MVVYSGGEGCVCVGAGGGGLPLQTLQLFPNDYYRIVKLQF